MTPVYSFPPIESPAARVLVLGSMPGAVSLRLQQYYGHPQNAFWKIVGEVLGFEPAVSYEQRAAALVQRKVAIWDVLASCVREGSLDSAIDDATMVANDFAAFFETHPHVVRVCFNGAKAESVYRRQVLQHLGTTRAIDYVRLPSTSPAHAGMRFQAKVGAWRVIADGQGWRK
ncbi:MAG: DNA-deoxyinosine glycosylase [Burkholderiaceae bacterium]